MIVIPMAGKSSRFFKAGYHKPKYMLEAHGKTLFEHSVCSFKQYFDTEKFLFIIQNSVDVKLFVELYANKLGIKDYKVISLQGDTRGQAESVYLGTKGWVKSEEGLTIFNIDTFRPGFTYPKIIETCSGYLEVFRGQGSNWSYAKPESINSTRVIKTAEKKRISDFCCTGLYFFKTFKLYEKAYLNYLNIPPSEWEKGELYIAPLYNYIINEGYNIHYNEIKEEDVIFCGTPDEYVEFKKK
tara:strand:+ start:3431 stop:4153 length:723 start_codon:yes stop_codon:yes gene_type:complete